MNIQVLGDEKKPLLRRREITVQLGYEDKTPSRLEIRKELAKKLKVKEELVIVKRIKPAYGTPAAELEVSIYDDENSLKKLEAEYMVNRHSPKEKKEKVKEEKKEEKKGEKGEKTPEEKKEETTEAKKASEPVAEPQKPKEGEKPEAKKEAEAKEEKKEEKPKEPREEKKEEVKKEEKEKQN